MKKSITSIALKNTHLKYISNWLSMPLHGKESRIRNRFIQMIEPRSIEIEKERLAKLTELAKKDDKGEPKLLDDKRTYDLTPENLKAFEDAMHAIGEESLVIDILPSNKETITSIKDILITIGDRLSLDPISGRAYDEVCEIFEKL